jgi:hypothetical protein
MRIDKIKIPDFYLGLIWIRSNCFSYIADEKAK